MHPITINGFPNIITAVNAQRNFSATTLAYLIFLQGEEHNTEALEDSRNGRKQLAEILLEMAAHELIIGSYINSKFEDIPLYDGIVEGYAQEVRNLRYDALSKYFALQKGIYVRSYPLSGFHFDNLIQLADRAWRKSKKYVREELQIIPEINID